MAEPQGSSVDPEASAAVDSVPQTPLGVEQQSGDHSPAKPHRRRTDWAKVEKAYVEGIEQGGELTWPTLDELAENLQVSRRQAAYHSRLHSWPAKREAFRTRFALELQQRKIMERLQWLDRAMGHELTIGNALYGLVRLAVNEAIQQARVKQSSPHPKTLEILADASLKAQRLIRTALGLPTDLLEASEAEERKRRERGGGEATLGELDRFLTWLNSLEGEDRLQAIDGIFGDTPAGRGQVIDLTPRHFRIRDGRDG